MEPAEPAEPVEPTEAEPGSATQEGTHAESPRAMADVATGSRAGTITSDDLQVGDPNGAPGDPSEAPGDPNDAAGGALQIERDLASVKLAADPAAERGVPSVAPSAAPSVGWNAASVRPVPSAAEALDKSDLSRMRAFHSFGVVAPIGAILLSLLLGGDARARVAFWIGACVLSLCNLGLAYLTRSPALYRPAPVGALWILSTFGVMPAVAYFGPFSAVVMVLMLGIVFISLGRVRWAARATSAVCIGGHLAIALPIILGWMPDRGVLNSQLTGSAQLSIAEILIVGFLTSGYALGRWARSSHANALADLQQAMRVIGDKEQALAEVDDQARRAARANEGRWTHQTMGSFRLGLVLGRGAMGEVYEATRGDGTPAAVKLLNARSTASTTLVERFHRELAVAARLESPYIVRVFELSPADAPVPYLAMERLHGIDLASRLRAENRMPSDELIVLIDQVARGLEIARQAGVVHRDLKPQNLFFHAGATWKILDFGVSKLLGTEGTLTGEGIVGTPQYMAPEQASGGQVSHLSDVYALGAIAYRCLTGRAPFRGRDLAELVYQVVHAAPVRPRSLGRVAPAIEDALAIAMAKDPRRRFASALAFSQAFIAARRGKPVGVEPPPGAWS